MSGRIPPILKPAARPGERSQSVFDSRVNAIHDRISRKRRACKRERDELDSKLVQLELELSGQYDFVKDIHKWQDEDDEFWHQWILTEYERERDELRGEVKQLKETVEALSEKIIYLEGLHEARKRDENAAFENLGVKMK